MARIWKKASVEAVASAGLAAVVYVAALAVLVAGAPILAWGLAAWWMEDWKSGRHGGHDARIGDGLEETSLEAKMIKYLHRGEDED